MRSAASWQIEGTFMSLEQELRRALRRTDPASGFDDRVLSRIAAGDTVRVPQTQSRLARFTLPIAASLKLSAGAGYYAQYQQHQQTSAQSQQADAERAAREVFPAPQNAS